MSRAINRTATSGPEALRGRDLPAVRARAVATAYKLPVTLIRAALTEHIEATRAWLTPATVAALGSRITITWVMLQRRDRSIPTAAAVYDQAGLFTLHPAPVPPADLAEDRRFGKVGALAAAWRHIIIEETAAALTRDGWLSPTSNPERLPLDRTARTYLHRNNITL